MGGGGAEVIYLNWCWGGGGGQVFWVDRIAPSKKLKPPQSGKIFVTRGSRKNCYGGGKPNNAPPPCRKRDLPPPTHTEKMAWPPRTWREKTAHIKNTPIGETPPPQMDFFYIHASPTWRAPISPPLACADHDL